MNAKNYYQRYWLLNHKNSNINTPPIWDKTSICIFFKLFKTHMKEPILDIGIGDGQIANLLLQRKVVNEIHGVDISTNALKKIKNPKIKIKVCDITTKLPYKNQSFNTVILTDVIEHILDVEKLLSEINRILKLQGKVLVVTPDYNIIKKFLIVLYWDKYFKPTNPHIRFFTKKTLNHVFQKWGFKNILYKWGLTWFNIAPQNSYSVYEKTKHISNLS